MRDDAHPDARVVEHGTHDEPTAAPGHVSGTPAVVGVVLGLAFAALYLLAVRTEAGQRLDGGSFAVVVGVWDATGPVSGTVRAGTPLLLAVLALVLLVLAVRARAWRRLSGAAMVVLVPTVGAQLLKDVLLGRPDLGDHGFPQNSYPSGHVAVTAALCVALVLLWPGGASRAVVAGWSVVALVAGAANVVSFAHRPADVLGSLLLVGAVTGATWWALHLGDVPPVSVRRRPPVRAP